MPLHVLGHANDTLSHAGDWLGSAAALPAPAAAQGALWGGAPFVRPGTSLYTSGSTEISSVALALESRCTSARMFSVAHCMVSGQRHDWGSWQISGTEFWHFFKGRLTYVNDSCKVPAFSHIEGGEGLL